MSIEKTLTEKGYSESEIADSVDNIMETAEDAVTNGGCLEDITEALLEEGLDADYEMEVLERLMGL